MELRETEGFLGLGHRAAQKALRRQPFTHSVGIN